MFARARHTAQTVAALVVLAAVEYLLGSASLHLLGQNTTVAVPWAVLIPTAAAATIGVTTRSAAADLEDTTSRSLPALRAGHLTIVLAVGLATTFISSVGLIGPISEPAALRNYLGFTGLALISAYFAGSSLAWPLPVAMAIAAATVGAFNGKPYGWAWPIHANGDPAAMLTAFISVGLGSLLVMQGGPRTLEASETDLLSRFAKGDHPLCGPIRRVHPVGAGLPVVRDQRRWQAQIWAGRPVQHPDGCWEETVPALDACCCVEHSFGRAAPGSAGGIGAS